VAQDSNNKQAKIQAKELQGVACKIENYNRAVEEITERGTRAQQARSVPLGITQKISDAEDLNKKVNSLS